MRNGKQDLNRIAADCARKIDTSIAHYRRLRSPESRVRHTDASIQVSFKKKKSGTVGGTFAAN